MTFKYSSFLWAFLFVVLAIFSTHSKAYAQGQAACYINTAGDYICPLGGNAGGTGTNNPLLNYNPGTSSVLGAGSPLLGALSGVPGVPAGLNSILTSLLGNLSPAMQNALLLQLAQLIGTNPSAAQIMAIVSQFQTSNALLNSLAGALCGATQAGPSFMSYANNSIGAQMAISGSSFSVTNAISSLCGGSGGAGSGSAASQACSQSGPSLTPTGTTPGARIASTANAMIGYSTRCVTGTNNGSLACAWVVSTILQTAGYPSSYPPSGSVTSSTQSLYDGLTADPCYTVVDMGNITAADASNLQPGDVLVTPTNWDSSGASGACHSTVGDGRCNSGHTGIYAGSGGIVSNGSANTAGPGAGVSQNYTVTSWSSITNRNTAQSAVFRRTCP